MKTFDLFRKHPKHSVWKGLAAGLIGGLAASWAANLLYRKLTESPKGSRTNDKPLKAEKELGQQEPAIDQPTTTISPGVFHQILAERERKKGIPAIQYAFGSAIGGLYGATAEILPKVTTGFGMPLAAVLWLGPDGVGNRTSGLSKALTNLPASSHLSMFASHLVYGFITEVIRYAVLRLLLSGFQLRL